MSPGWLLLLSWLTLWAGPPAVDGEALGREIDAVVGEHMQATGVPGVVVAVTVGDEVVVLRGYGMADVEAGRAIDPERTLVRVASLSKTFTATLVAMLEDEGRVDLDADVDGYLQRLRTANPDFSQPVTLRHLLAHTAGYINYNPGRVALPPGPDEDLADFLARTMPPRMHPVGTATLYCNHGNALAGLVVAEVEGRRFEAVAAARIFAPLGMDATRYHVDVDDPALSASYRVVGAGGDRVLARQRYELFLTTPASAVHSTAADMARYLILHAGAGSGEVLSLAALQRMRTPRSTIDPALPSYHYAFAPGRIHGHPVRSHGGSVPAFLSRMVIFDEQQVGVFVAQNAFADNVADAVIEVVAAALPAPAPDPAPALATTLAGDGRPATVDGLLGDYRALDKHETAAFTRPVAVLRQPALRIDLDDQGFLRVDGLRFWATARDDVFVATDPAHPGTGERVLLVVRDDGGQVRWIHLDRSSAQRLGWFARAEVQIGAHLLGLLLLIGGLLRLPAETGAALRRVWLAVGAATLAGLLLPQIVALIVDAGQPVYAVPMRLGIPWWIIALRWLPPLAAVAALGSWLRRPSRGAAAATLGIWLLLALDLWWRTPAPGLSPPG